MTKLPLLLCLCCLAAGYGNPKVASQKPKAFSVPLIQPIVVTNQIAWFNHAPLPPSNVVQTVLIGSTQTNRFAMSRGIKAYVVGPSNQVMATVFSLDTNGLSKPSNTVTNRISFTSGPPVTNIWLIQPMFSTDMINWIANGTPWWFTNVGSAGNGFWRLVILPQ